MRTHPSATPLSRRSFVTLLGCAAVTAVAAGCGHSARNLSLDPEKAKKSCTAFMDAWKGGKRIEDLHPDIIGRDEAWEGDFKLVSYELQPETSDGTNLHIPVKLTMKNPKGKEVKETVTYVVGTSPKVTVFRE